MERVEEDDAQEIFLECDSVSTKELWEAHQDITPYNRTINNNNHRHVVYVGVVAVLLTVYLGVTNVQKCLVSCVENTLINEQVKHHRDEIFNYVQQTKKPENTAVLEGLLKYKDICKDLEIFTKQQEKNLEVAEIINDNKRNEVLNIEEANGSTEENEDISGSSGDGNCAKRYTKQKQKISKYSIKTTSTKNGFNKSTPAKSQKSIKKDLNLNKKNSTAEPIIYLFALVFIYLLLKAASDINQHYKSKNKNDKRLRRCSLQSYAQTHRPDRRASKELSLKQKQQKLQQGMISLSRSSSQEQPHHCHHHHDHLIHGAAQKSSELKQQAVTGTSIQPNDSYYTNWQLLRQHSTTQSIDNSDILSNTLPSAELTSSLMARRCSVPAALSCHRQKLSFTSPLGIVNDNVNVNVGVSRRTSVVASNFPLSTDPNESFTPETKRRVRMINRH